MLASTTTWLSPGPSSTSFRHSPVSYRGSTATTPGTVQTAQIGLTTTQSATFTQQHRLRSTSSKLTISIVLTNGLIHVCSHAVVWCRVVWVVCFYSCKSTNTSLWCPVIISDQAVLSVQYFSLPSNDPITFNWRCFFLYKAEQVFPVQAREKKAKKVLCCDGWRHFIQNSWSSCLLFTQSHLHVTTAVEAFGSFVRLALQLSKKKKNIKCVIQQSSNLCWNVQSAYIFCLGHKQENGAL